MKFAVTAKSPLCSVVIRPRSLFKKEIGRSEVYNMAQALTSMKNSVLGNASCLALTLYFFYYSLVVVGIISHSKA